MHQYFITGTDTNCGKTYVTCKILDYFKKNLKIAQALKPIASGAIFQDGQFINDDIIKLQEHNCHSTNIINGWLYPEAISPHIAAKQNGEELSALKIAKFCTEFVKNKENGVLDYLLIEGAGGLMVPLNAKETWLDFLKITKIPVILIVGIRLGCINHALLTDTVLKYYNIPSKGWIANCIDKNMQASKENIATLRNKMHMPLIATVTNCGNITQLNEF